MSSKSDKSADALSQEASDHNATEAAAKKAVDEDVSLSQVEGTGSGGKIVVADVESAAASGSRQVLALPASSSTDVVNHNGVDYPGDTAFGELQKVDESFFDAELKDLKDSDGNPIFKKEVSP